MRAWDGRARLHVALAVLNALAIASVEAGALRLAALGAAVAGAALLVRSLRRAAEPSGLRLDEAPSRSGEIYLGRGFEWSIEAAQETLESGRPANRGEGELWVPEGLLSQHLLALGATGTGKTRLLELLALQAIARGEALIVIDPKGDAALEQKLRRAAGERFRLFSLPHPGRSVRYNPIGRYHEVHEVADRVAALLPGTGDALPFRNFAWDVVDTVVRELHGKRPVTLRNLRRCAIDRPVGRLAERPRDHYLKMASALIPILGKLATEQLSPDRGGLSWEEVDRNREVVYFSLGSLLGQETAGAVAKMATLDLAGYVGARYAYGKGWGPIWLLVDELGDVVTPELIGVLNKARGAGLRVVACAQTASDLEAALGSRARAFQVLGNASTLVQFRALSSSDAEVFSEAAGARLLRTRSEGESYEPALFASGLRGVDDFRARFGESVSWGEHALVPPWAVVQLPTLGFFMRSEGRILRGRVPLLS